MRTLKIERKFKVNVQSTFAFNFSSRDDVLIIPHGFMKLAGAGVGNRVER